MSWKTTMNNIDDAITTILENLVDDVGIRYFHEVKKGKLQKVDNFPLGCFWKEPRVPMGNDYLDGDLIRQEFIVAGYDFSPEMFASYEEAEARSEEMSADLRKEFTKWEHRNLSGAVFQMQVIDAYLDPGVAPFEGGGLMAAGGVKILLVYRQNRGT